MNAKPIEPSSDTTARGEQAELMYIKCSVCGKWMDVKPGNINFISHSYCPTCYEAAMKKLRTKPAADASSQ